MKKIDFVAEHGVPMKVGKAKLEPPPGMRVSFAMRYARFNALAGVDRSI